MQILHGAKICPCRRKRHRRGTDIARGNATARITVQGARYSENAERMIDH